MTAMNPARDTRMSLGEHLEELRWRLILGLAGVLVACCITVWFANDLFTLLCQPLLAALEANGLPPQINFLTVAGPFLVYVKISLVSGIILGSPWLVHQLWRFVSAGLYDSERRLVYVLAPLSALMVVLAVLFTYFAMLPLCLKFFVGFARTQFPSSTASTSMVNLIVEANQYISFVTLVALGVAVGFQLPVVMLVLGYLRLVDPKWLARYRRHCLFVCAFLGALLTPADLLSMIVLTVPLYALFELGLILMRWAGRRRSGLAVAVDAAGA